jgi:hypothetical protein
MVSLFKKHDRVKEEMEFVEKNVLVDTTILEKASDKLMFMLRYPFQNFNEEKLLEFGYSITPESNERYTVFAKYIAEESICCFFSLDKVKKVIYFSINI